MNSSVDCCAFTVDSSIDCCTLAVETSMDDYNPFCLPIEIVLSAKHTVITSCDADSVDDCGQVRILPCMDDVKQSGILSLECIYRLCCKIFEAFAKSPENAVVIGPCHSRTDLSNASLLAGAFRILCQESTLSDVIALLEPVSSCFERYEEDLTVHDALGALDYAKKIGWLAFRSNFEHPASVPVPANFLKLDMAEFMHYASNVHGRVHIVVPGKIFVFPEPACERICSCQSESVHFAQLGWADVKSARYFSAAFYAELLNNLKVNSVLKNRPSQPECAFRAKDIQVEDMDLSKCDAMLHKADRLHRIASHPRSVIALQRCSGHASQGDRVLTMLLLTLLIRQYAFSPATSLAWLRMVLQS